MKTRGKHGKGKYRLLSLRIVEIVYFERSCFMCLLIEVLKDTVADQSGQFQIGLSLKSVRYLT